jgi:hypothetical protein
MSLPKRLFESAKGWLPDSVFLSLYHRHKVGRFPNLRAPRTFNEKILKRCLHPDPRYTMLTDKLSARDYVRRTAGEHYLIPLLADPDVFTREVFDALPSSFVMKANHGSGFVQLVRDKSRISFEQLSDVARGWLATDFYRVMRERHYRPIQPRIFFESLLLEDDGAVPADIKVHCFFDRRERAFTIYIALISDRFGEHPRADMYDAQWTQMDMSIGHYPRSRTPAPCPENFDELLWVATTLAEGFDYVRVDLYAPGGQIYFGELTFTPGAGVFPMRPDRIDYEWGKLIGV